MEFLRDESFVVGWQVKINGLVQWPDRNGCIGEVQTDGGPCLDGRLVGLQRGDRRGVFERHLRERQARSVWGPISMTQTLTVIRPLR